MEAALKELKDRILQRTRQHFVDTAEILLFHLLKTHAPGSAAEKKTLNQRITNPPVCSKPQSALNTPTRWKQDFKRLEDLGAAVPDINLLHPALESIWGEIFDKAEAMLHYRWIQLKLSLDIPRCMTGDKLMNVSRFAEAALQNLAIHGHSAQNICMPQTDAQKARAAQQKENQKRAAAATVKPPSSYKNQLSLDPNPKAVPPPPDDAAAGVVRKYATTSAWAN